MLEYLRKIVLRLSIKIQVYGGTNIVPITVPESCCLKLPLNSK